MTQSKARNYIVVENAGMDREQDIRHFETYSAAVAWIEKMYSVDECDPTSSSCLHLDICREIGGERSYFL